MLLLFIIFDTFIGIYDVTLCWLGYLIGIGDGTLLILLANEVCDVGIPKDTCILLLICGDGDFIDLLLYEFYLCLLYVV